MAKFEDSVGVPGCWSDGESLLFISDHGPDQCFGAFLGRGGMTHNRYRSARAAVEIHPSILSAAIAMIGHMDLFDGEPYLALLPRRLVRIAAIALLIALALIPPVRQWWIDQAMKHATHEIQPLINDLLRQTQPSPSDRGPSNTAQVR